MPDIQREELHYDLLVKKVRILDPEFRILDDMDIAILIDAERYTPYMRLSELYPDAAELSEFIRVCSLV